MELHTATISRAYTFEAAHRLPFVPEGHKCGRMHGHSYTVTVAVTGIVHHRSGMVMDFADIDTIVKPLIDTLDHRTLNDVIPNPTSELLAIHLWSKVSSVLDGDHDLAVTVSETARSSCTYSGPHHA